MVDLIAKKHIGRTKPGDALRVTRAEARALIALQLAEVPKKPEPTPALLEAPAKRAYRRRDMTAEQPAAYPIVPPISDNGEA